MTIIHGYEWSAFNKSISSEYSAGLHLFSRVILSIKDVAASNTGENPGISLKNGHKSALRLLSRKSVPSALSTSS